MIHELIFFLHTIYREVKVYLNCNHSAKVPVITTTGDSVIRHTYVSFHTCPYIDKTVLLRTRVQHTQLATVVVKTSLSGFDVIAAGGSSGVNMISNYLKYSTTATTPCTVSASCTSVLAWPINTQLWWCCNHKVMSNPEIVIDVFTTTIGPGRV